jgi:hypothetical protein
VTNVSLKYAYFNGVAWISETVDSIGGLWADSFTSLALDVNGRPHISYLDKAEGDLKYAYHDGRTWWIETVDNEGYVGGFSSLALDASGRPHISYLDEFNGDLKYAYSASPSNRFQDSSRWQIETVDSTGLVGAHTSLALDADNQPHISYCLFHWALVPVCDDLRYAHFDGTAWITETVHSRYGHELGQWSSLDLDSADRPHIAYSDDTDSDLIYAYPISLPYSYYLPVTHRGW